MMSPSPTPKRPRRTRNAVAAILLGTTVLTGASLGVLAQSAPPATPPVNEAMPAVPAPLPSEALPSSFADLVERISPAVVNITARQERVVSRRGPELRLPRGTPFDDFFRQFEERFGPGQEMPQGPRVPGAAQGSGFIIDDEGYVVTNNHVVDGADEITVTLQDGTELRAELVGADAATDLALLKVESDEPLPYLNFGDSEKARVGDWVIAVGNPFGLGGTVTTGIISAVARDINAGPYDDFLQVDAAINRGNSGGPLFDLNGDVIGINTAIFSPTGGSVGIGFAVPSSMAQPIIAELRENGTVERGWLGVQIQGVTPEIADSLGLEQQRGALVASVVPDSPAAAAGIRQGDVILGYGDRDIGEVRDLSRFVAATDAGTEQTLTVWRNGEEITIEVEIGQLDQTEQMAAVRPSPDTPNELLGLRLSRLDDEARAELGLDDSVTGVLVVGVESADLPVRPGDVIVKVGSDAIDSPDDLADKIKEAEAAGRSHVLVLVNRNGNEQFVTLEVSPA